MSGAAGADAEPGLDPAVLALVEAGLGGPDPDVSTVWAAWLGPHAALIRDAPPALAEDAGRTVDVRAALLAATGFARLTAATARPPELGARWAVRLTGGLLTEVATRFDPNPQTLSCGWQAAGDTPLAMAPAWLADARRAGRVALVSTELGLPADTADPDVIGARLQIQARRGLVMAGLAVLDDAR
jgi:hypothetical protein